MLFLKILAILNLAYFALIAVLQWKVLKQKEAWKRKDKLLRLSDSKFRTRIEYTGEWCLPAFSVRNSGSWEDGSRHVLVQLYWIFGKLWLHLALKPWFRGEWGVSLTGINNDGWQQVHVNAGYHREAIKGDRYWIFDMPWTFDWYQTSYLVKEPKDGVLFWPDRYQGQQGSAGSIRQNLRILQIRTGVPVLVRVERWHGPAPSCHGNRRKTGVATPDLLVC